MSLRRTLVGERVKNPSGQQIRKKLKQSKTARDFKMRPGYIYTVVRAISARINQNYDGWPADELKKSYHTFIGKPVFVNHENYDPKLARGVVVAARFVENGNDKFVEVIQEIDAGRFPLLAHEIKTGGLDSVSMGAEAAFTICSYCSHKATDESDMCDHVRFHKGEKLRKFNKRTGKVDDILVYESCHKLGFFELSYVFDPADETAVASKVLVASHAPERKTIDASAAPLSFEETVLRTAGFKSANANDDYAEFKRKVETGEIVPEKGPQTPGEYRSPAQQRWLQRDKQLRGSFEAQVLAAAGIKHAYGETEAPPQVDTLREEGSVPEDDNDDFHHYVESPDELQDPDLSQAGQIDREQDQQPAPQQQGVGDMGANPEDNPADAQQYMVLKIPVPPAGGAPPAPGGMPPGGAPPPQVPQQAFAAKEGRRMVAWAYDEHHNVKVARSTVAFFDDYFGRSTLGNGHEVSGNSRNPTKGSTMGRSSTLAQRGKVAAAGRQRIAEGPNVDGGDRSRNDQGEQEEAFLSETPPPDPAVVPHDGDEIHNSPENLVARVKAGREALLRDAKALAEYQARQRKQGGTRRTADEEPVLVNPTVTDPDSEALTGDHFESLGEAPVETQPRDASLHKFQAFDNWLSQATGGRRARDLTEVGVKRAATEFAKRAKIDVREMFPALGIVLREARKNETAIKAAAAKKKGSPMQKRAEDDKLELAAPDDRIDPEAPTVGDTDEEAQASQFDRGAFGDNAGDNLAKPDLSTDSQFWPPGEGKKSSRRPQATQVREAGGILAVQAAEAYINAGLEAPERKYQLAGLFEHMNRGIVQRDIALLSRVAQVQAQQRRKVASGRTRGAGSPTIPPNLVSSGGSRRVASTRRQSANDPTNDSLLFG